MPGRLKVSSCVVSVSLALLVLLASTGFAQSPDAASSSVLAHPLGEQTKRLPTMELQPGLLPMSQYDAAAMPMYVSFGAAPTITPFSVITPLIDVDAKNTRDSYGAKQSSRMDFRDVDRAPTHALNEIIWKDIKGKDSVMPLPVHRFRPITDANESKDGDDDDKD